MTAPPSTSPVSLSLLRTFPAHSTRTPWSRSSPAALFLLVAGAWLNVPPDLGTVFSNRSSGFSTHISKYSTSHICLPACQHCVLFTALFTWKIQPTVAIELGLLHTQHVILLYRPITFTFIHKYPFSYTVCIQCLNSENTGSSNFSKFQYKLEKKITQPHSDSRLDNHTLYWQDETQPHLHRHRHRHSQRPFETCLQ